MLPFYGEDATAINLTTDNPFTACHLSPEGVGGDGLA